MRWGSVALRFRIELRDETLQELELATERRFSEGLALLASGQPYGAVYLLGYAAEMLLKLAYFGHVGARPADRVAGLLGPARSNARSLIPALGHENYHSVLFWVELLLAVRRRSGSLLPREVEQRLRQRVRRLYSNWWVPMRYRDENVTPLEVQSVLEDVTWLRARWRELRR